MSVRPQVRHLIGKKQIGQGAHLLLHFYIRCSLYKLLKTKGKEPVCKAQFARCRKCLIFNSLRFQELRPILLKRAAACCFGGISPTTKSSTAQWSTLS